MSVYKPTTKNELWSIIEQELDKQGPDADLNFIDTSEIRDMSRLFSFLETYVEPRNIKIDKWDTSNVTNMAFMFHNCYKFNCDLSRWDTSNVFNMTKMFYRCKYFKSDLSSWDVSKVRYISDMFYECPNMCDVYKSQLNFNYNFIYEW